MCNRTILVTLAVLRRFSVAKNFDGDYPVGISTGHEATYISKHLGEQL